MNTYDDTSWIRMQMGGMLEDSGQGIFGSNLHQHALGGLGVRRYQIAVTTATTF